ncbi:MAG: hypothetical protein WBG02_09760 [Candidatus Acidiferrum sp.]
MPPRDRIRRMRGMGKWLFGAYVVVMLFYAMIHLRTGTLAWTFALKAALWVFVGGAAMITAFASLCAKASMPRDALDYLGKDGKVTMPLAVRLLTWSAYAVLVVGSAIILAGLCFS